LPKPLPVISSVVIPPGEFRDGTHPVECIENGSGSCDFDHEQALSEIISDCKPKMSSLESGNHLGDSSPPMAGQDSIDNKAVAERLRRVMDAYGIRTVRQFAIALEVAEDRLGVPMRGGSLSNQIAFRVCQKFPGVTLDWLYFGRADMLSPSMQKSLGEAPGANAPPSTTTKAGRRG
jgi:hypothetical protein